MFKIGDHLGGLVHIIDPDANVDSGGIEIDGDTDRTHQFDGQSLTGPNGRSETACGFGAYGVMQYDADGDIKVTCAACVEAFKVGDEPPAGTVKHGPLDVRRAAAEEIWAAATVIDTLDRDGEYDSVENVDAVRAIMRHTANHLTEPQRDLGTLEMLLNDPTALRLLGMLADQRIVHDAVSSSKNELAEVARQLADNLVASKQFDIIL